MLFKGLNCSITMTAMLALPCPEQSRLQSREQTLLSHFLHGPPVTLRSRDTACNVAQATTPLMKSYKASVYQQNFFFNHNDHFSIEILYDCMENLRRRNSITYVPIVTLVLIWFCGEVTTSKEKEKEKLVLYCNTSCSL